LSKEVGTEKPCPENIELSICHELNYKLGRTLRSSWGNTLRYLGYVGEVCPHRNLTLVKMEWAMGRLGGSVG